MKQNGSSTITFERPSISRMVVVMRRLSPWNEWIRWLFVRILRCQESTDRKWVQSADWVEPFIGSQQSFGAQLSPLVHPQCRAFIAAPGLVH